MKTCTSLLVALLLALASPVFAIAPESGMYWQPNYSGRAFYIEHQNGRVGVAVYAFDRETGAAEIYVSGGLLRDDGPMLFMAPDPPFSPDGLLPAHWYDGVLYKASHGPALTGPHPPGQSAQTERVGRIVLNFLNAGGIFADIFLDDNAGSMHASLERFAFGHARYSGQFNSRIAVDLRGEWVFVDMTDPQQEPLRFDFSVQEPPNHPLDLSPTESYAITYIDPQRDARLVCASQPAGDSGDPLEPRKTSGCELFVGDELLFAAKRNDVGLDRIQAFRGALVPRHGVPYRRPDAVIGLRVVMPPPPPSAEAAGAPPR